jgi:hypothetical protein
MYIFKYLTSTGAEETVKWAVKGPMPSELHENKGTNGSVQ